jgi:hypothetical protein
VSDFQLIVALVPSLDASTAAPESDPPPPGDEYVAVYEPAVAANMAYDWPLMVVVVKLTGLPPLDSADNVAVPGPATGTIPVRPLAPEPTATENVNVLPL